jgi:Rha family phage regulatory protein
MNQLVFIENNRVVTDSLTVAEAFRKEHARVLRDVRELKCSSEFRVGNFAESYYNNAQGRPTPKYLITQDGFTLLVMGYTGQKAMEFKEKYIKEFRKMESQLHQLTAPSYAIEDPIERAKKWIEEQREVKMLEQRVAEYEPKITYLDQILKSKDAVTITQIAKDYGLSGQELNKILNEEKVQYKLNGQWLLYRKYQDKGYTKSQTIDVVHKDGRQTVKMNTRWTQKGRLFIHEILNQRNIVPVLDRELVEA